jgi:hypothetical protein
VPHSDADLWTCPDCGQKLVSKNMSHSCGRYKMEDLFAGCEPRVWDTYQALEKMALSVAPFHIIPQKTRFCYQLRMRCVNGTVARGYLKVGFVLPRVIEDQRIERVETFSPVLHLHTVRLRSVAEVDEQVREWLELSTVCGEQRHLKR